MTIIGAAFIIVHQQIHVNEKSNGRSNEGCGQHNSLNTYLSIYLSIYLSACLSIYGHTTRRSQRHVLPILQTPGRVERVCVPDFGFNGLGFRV